MHKVITFGIPSYNAAKDMDHCITSILEGSNYATDIEIIVVDDGSKDETAAKADEWEARYPGIIRAVHQENGGHGIAVLSGLREAQGTYYKVVDSDDWLDGAALSTMLSILRGFEERDQRVDLFISNYVYEKVYEGTHTAIGYKFALPRKKIFSWDQIGHFRLDQNLLMHSLCYRTDVLRESNLPMPPHTFYVDNIYAYVPLPRCKTMYYADIDLYRYFIGREGQSVNEATMVKRLGQQFVAARAVGQQGHHAALIVVGRLEANHRRHRPGRGNVGAGIGRAGLIVGINARQVIVAHRHFHPAFGRLDQQVDFGIVLEGRGDRADQQQRAQ